MSKSVKKIIISTLIMIIIVSIPVSKIVIEGYTKYKEIVSNIGIDEKIIEIKNNPNYIKLKNVNENFLDAIVSIEDHRFYNHNGLDYIGIIRAAVNNIKEGEIVQGGSTISQQLAKNMFLNGEKDFSRKVTEALLVNDIEEKYSKDEILEIYVNIINYGNGYVGIKEASRGYFNETADNLTYKEATMLAGLPQCPNKYNPNKYYKRALIRQETVIEAMNKYSNKEFKDEYYLLSVDMKCVL